MGYMEIASLGLGMLSGFVFKYLAQQAQDRQQTLDLLLRKVEALDTSADKASKRDSSESGKRIRRFIVVSLICGLIFFPFLLTLIHEDTIVEIKTPIKTFLGLFHWGGGTKYYSLQGFLITQEVRCAILAVVGYYFGNSSAQKE